MPFGYIFSVALLAFCTAAAVIGPRPAHTTPSHWSYWATFLINELPFLALYVLIADSVLAYAQGDLLTPGGLVGLAAAVLTAVGLAVLIRRALATGPELRRALADGAGIGLPPSHLPWAHILLAPFGSRRRDVARVANIPYGDAGRRNLLDVYHRRERPSGGPVLVYFLGEAPPFLFLHGVNDSSVLVEDVREFAARLSEASSSPVVLGELPGAQHAYDLFRSVRYSYVIDAVGAFGAWVSAGTGPEQEAV